MQMFLLFFPAKWQMLRNKISVCFSLKFTLMLPTEYSEQWCVSSYVTVTCAAILILPIPWCGVSFVGLRCLPGYTHSFPNSRKWQEICQKMGKSELISPSVFLVRQAIFFLLNQFYLDPCGIFLHFIFFQSCRGEGARAIAWTSGNWPRQTATRNNIS